MTLSPLTDALIGAAASAVTLLAGLMVPMLPRLWVWLRVRINGADAELLRQAIENVAADVAVKVKDDYPTHRAVEEMVDYVRASLPRALARLSIPAETLDRMCRVALARALG